MAERSEEMHGGPGRSSPARVRPTSNRPMSALITVVMLLIFDLTRPRQGRIGVSQQPLIDLQRSIGSPKP